MSVAMILSSAALSISLIITAIKLIDGFVRADPRALIRIGTWLLCLIAVASLPCLIVLLIYQQWALAMMLGAGMLIVLTLLNWRSILARANFQPMWTEAGDVEPVRGGHAQPAPDARTGAARGDRPGGLPGACRQRAIRCAHCRARTGAGVERQPRSSLLSPEEALDVLGLAQWCVGVGDPCRSSTLGAAGSSGSWRLELSRREDQRGKGHSARGSGGPQSARWNDGARRDQHRGRQRPRRLMVCRMIVRQRQ